MIIGLLNIKDAMTLAQSQHLNLTSSQQLSPSVRELAEKEKASEVLKPFLMAAKAAEGKASCISECIPLLKRLRPELNAVSPLGIETLRLKIYECWFQNKYNSCYVKVRGDIR